MTIAQNINNEAISMLTMNISFYINADLLLHLPAKI